MGIQEAASWAWLGGFFEGEGNIYIRRERNRSVRLAIGQVDKRPLELTRLFLQQKGLGCSIYSRQGGGNRRDSWIVHINAKEDVRYVLKHLRPFLIGKQAQCDDALDFLETIKAGGRRRSLTIEQQAEINELYHAGYSSRALAMRFRIGRGSVRRAVIGAMRGNNKGLRLCPACGVEKRWSKGRDGHSTLCRTCADELKRGNGSYARPKEQGEKP